MCYNIIKIAKQNYQFILSATGLNYERERERVINARRVFILINPFKDTVFEQCFLFVKNIVEL
ncbi:hypothetical protein KJ636_03025 [Patescibacteria group bacterium]|nr:hypothetical protein [Patescibacteria group bacterium]MBU4481669.1 hypothetical protein [Patescibacteria group bacterium]